MTISEFKAWLDGFSEAIGDAPTPDQWSKIKTKIDELQTVSLKDISDWYPNKYPISPSIADPKWTFVSTCDARS